MSATALFRRLHGDDLQMLLTQQRVRALADHCRLAVETMHPRFAFVYRRHGVVLTVNSGYE
jgi:hypothetical protein